jgi:hypothetical protein
MAIIQLDAKQAAMEESEERQKLCDEVGAAINQGTLGEIVAKHERLILKYYEDVLQQANQSFELARSIARMGFYVLVSSLICAILIDILHRFKMVGDQTGDSFSNHHCRSHRHDNHRSYSGRCVLALLADR